jgi:hypothetical protein
MTESINRLTVVGARCPVRLFQNNNWARSLGARHAELLENSPGRAAWQFESEGVPLASLQWLSRCWPRLTFRCTLRPGEPIETPGILLH